MSEIFPEHVRGTAASVATLVNWSCSFLLTETFAALVGCLGKDGIFFLFAGVCGGTVAFVAAVVPETKGRTLEEIGELFKRP